MEVAKTFLVTGALGCIGAWTLKHLVEHGMHVVSFDISTQKHRLDLLLSAESQNAITFVKGDLTKFDQVLQAFREHTISHVIHLAALQIPFCKADPVQGARVNVVGTVNVFEAARQVGLEHIAYASSVGVYGPPVEYDAGLIPNDAPFKPRTLYGVYKVANEETARVYWQDHGISSTALRPYIVYGPGRDQGLTSDPTKAMHAVASGEPFHINFGGMAQYHFASDVALQFIAAAQRPLEGALGFNLGTEPRSVADIIGMIRALEPDAEVTHTSDVHLPFPVCDGRVFRRYFPDVPQTSLEEGLRQTLKTFREVV